MAIYKNDDHLQTLDAINHFGLPRNSANPNWNPSRIIKLISDGEYQSAFNQLKSLSAGLELANIKAVLLMRLGRPNEAISLLRPLIFDLSLLSLKPGIPNNVVINFATALLMTGHVGGCLEIIDGLPDQKNDKIKRIRKSIRDWEKTLSWMSWFDWKLCSIEHCSDNLTISHLPGVLDWEDETMTHMPAGPANTRTATPVHDLAV